MARQVGAKMTVEENQSATPFYFQSRGLSELLAEDDLPWDGPQISILDSPTLCPQYLKPTEYEGNDEEDDLPMKLIPTTETIKTSANTTTCSAKQKEVVKHMGRRRRCRAKFQYTQFNCNNGVSMCEAPVEDSSAEFQSKRFSGDLYTPTWIRGRGNSREGLCSLCIPPVWFRMKQSAYWYE